MSRISRAADLMAGSLAAVVRDIEHVRIHGDPTTYCGHPRQCGLFYFGGGELAAMHHHAPCAYERPSDVEHDFGGYHSRSVVLLQRSFDDGRTWPSSDDVVVWNEAAPLEERLRRVVASFGSPRERIDLSQPRSIIWVARTFLGPAVDGVHQWIPFSIRSPDGGRRWEAVPTLIQHPPDAYGSSPDNAPLARLPDGTLLMPMRSLGGRPGTSLYASSDDGLSWRYRTHICDQYLYAALLRLPSGRLQCYTYPLAMCHSDDEGHTWSELRRLSPREPSAWATDDPVYRDDLARRSPTPLLLRDGRILILFARRLAPMGIGLIVSHDGGVTWSVDLPLRSDAAASQQVVVNGRVWDYADIGYPLAVELEDGRIFVVYYYTLRDGNRFGGPRFIAGTWFRLG